MLTCQPLVGHTPSSLSCSSSLARVPSPACDMVSRGDEPRRKKRKNASRRRRLKLRTDSNSSRSSSSKSGISITDSLGRIRRSGLESHSRRLVIDRAVGSESELNINEMREHIQQFKQNTFAWWALSFKRKNLSGRSSMGILFSLFVSLVNGIFLLFCSLGKVLLRSKHPINLLCLSPGKRLLA